MKRLLIILLMIILNGCSNNEDKAIKLIKLELSKTMNDFGSYEAVEFKKLDSTFTDFDTQEFLNNDKISFRRSEQKDSLMRVNIKAFKPQFNGYKMIHTFRGKNALGALVMNDYIFFFDKDLKTIVEYKDRVAALEKANKDFDEAMAEIDRLKTEINQQ